PHRPGLPGRLESRSTPQRLHRLRRDGQPPRAPVVAGAAARRSMGTGRGAQLAAVHLVNIGLHGVSHEKPAWPERKAEPFTVTPLHSGSSVLGYRPSRDYGGGITLGTAVAISGAAASPNMGYHSSPTLAFLLTLFNVRLGWWLGNPGSSGEKRYRLDGP